MTPAQISIVINAVAPVTVCIMLGVMFFVTRDHSDAYDWRARRWAAYGFTGVGVLLALIAIAGFYLVR